MTRIALDNNILLAFISESTTEYDSEGLLKIRILKELVASKHVQVILPAPVLTEFLSRESTIRENLIDRSDFHVYAFDELSALQTAVHHKTLKEGQIKSDNPRQAAKVDSQIIGLCVAHEIDVLYTEDIGLIKIANKLGLCCKKIADVEIPVDRKQQDIEYHISSPEVVE
jgi:predicted nucleic acid-binding protein